VPGGRPAHPSQQRWAHRDVLVVDGRRADAGLRGVRGVQRRRGGDDEDPGQGGGGQGDHGQRGGAGPCEHGPFLCREG